MFTFCSLPGHFEPTSPGHFFHATVGIAQTSLDTNATLNSNSNVNTTNPVGQSSWGLWQPLAAHA